MRTPYTEEIKPLCNLSKTFWINKIYDHVITSDLNTLFNSLRQNILSTPDIFHDFFSFKNYQMFFYETMLDIYHLAYLSCSYQKNKKYNKSQYCNTFLDYVRTNTSNASLRVDISNKEKELLKILKQLETPQNRITLSRKTLDYYTLIAKYITKPYIPLDKCSLIYNLRNYSLFIYNDSYYKKGIQYYTFQKTQQEFLNSHPSKHSIVSFENEYACYVNEKLHYSIHFQKCMNMFCSRGFNADEITERVHPLFVFTKIYDTPYLSLSRYIEDKYATVLTRLYDTDSESCNYIDSIFIETQIYNTYILPLLSLLIKKILFVKYNGNYEKIMEITKEYITSYLDQDSFNTSFYKTLESEFFWGEQIEYPFDSKMKISQPLPNTNCTEANFNKLFSIYFYTDDFFNYLERFLHHPDFLSLEDCKSCIAHNYFSKQKNASTLSINETIEAINHKKEKMLII